MLFLLLGQLSEKLAECEDVLGDVMMDIRPKLAIMILVNSHSSRTITMSLMNQVTSFAESTDDKELKRCVSINKIIAFSISHYTSPSIHCIIIIASCILSLSFCSIWVDS